MARNLYPDLLYAARKWDGIGGNAGKTLWQVIPIKASYQGYNKGVLVQADGNLNFAQLNMYKLWTQEWLSAYNNYAPEGTGEYKGYKSYSYDYVWLPKANSWHVVQGHIDYDVLSARKRLRHGEYVLEQIVDGALTPPVTLPDYDERDVEDFERITRHLHTLINSEEYNNVLLG